jgi:hypothetical protein
MLPGARLQNHSPEARKVHTGLACSAASELLAVLLAAVETGAPSDSAAKRGLLLLLPLLLRCAAQGPTTATSVSSSTTSGATPLKRASSCWALLRQLFMVPWANAALISCWKRMLEENVGRE